MNIRRGLAVAAFLGFFLTSSSNAAPDATACAPVPVRDGCGVFTWPDGSRYVGEFRGGEIDGHGVLTLPDGSTLEADYSEWTPVGDAVFHGADGSTVKGRIRSVRMDPSQERRPMHYPFWQGLAGHEANVIVAVIVAANGTVKTAVNVTPSDHESFNEEAVAGVLQWRYLPATIDGHPIPTLNAALLEFNNGR